MPGPSNYTSTRPPASPCPCSCGSSSTPRSTAIGSKDASVNWFRLLNERQGASPAAAGGAVPDAEALVVGFEDTRGISEFG